MDQIRDAIAQRRMLPFFGAGVSKSLCPASKSWVELIESGAAYLSEQSDFNAGLVHSMLEQPSPAMLTAAATVVQSDLKRINRFGEWVAREFETLKPSTDGIASAIAAYSGPILTTNYDDLVEQATGFKTVTFSDGGQDARRALQVREPAVIHLHGFWKDPDSLVFSAGDYGRAVNDSRLQVIQQSLAVMSVFLFVGCGEGLEDPNIGSLLAQFNEWGTPDLRSVALTRGDRRSPLPGVDAHSYGDEFDDLEPYLKSLFSIPHALTTTGGDQFADFAAEAFERVLEPIREELVAGDPLGEEVDIDSRIVPPVILPVDNETYARSREADEARIERLSASVVAADGGSILLVGGEQTGLTTSLRWLIAERFKVHADGVPVYVDYRLLREARKPLRSYLLDHLKVCGLRTKENWRSFDFPPLLLAIDNFVVSDSVRWERLVQELGDLRLPLVVIGTREATEFQDYSALQSVLPDLRVLYTGRLNETDIALLAKGLSPVRFRALASRTIVVIREQQLPRTPFTVTLLLNALAAGETMTSTASQTLVLDSYLSRVLGRGEASDDSRWGMSSADLQAVLEHLATVLLYEDKGALAESKVIASLEEFFERFGWSEIPSVVLNTLVSRRLLRYHDENLVGFAQASYLHLYAARAATGDDKVRLHLLNRPLRYAEAIKHYVSLNRGDRDALERVVRLLGSTTLTSDLANPRFSRELRPRQVPDEQLDRVLDEFETEDLLIEEEAADLLEAEDDDPNFGLLDSEADPEYVPFPVDDDTDMPPLRRAVLVLTLSSNVVRDSEMVTDLSLKRDVLEAVLSGWVEFVSVLESDETFNDMMTDVFDQLPVPSRAAPERIEAAKRVFIDTAGLTMSFGMMTATLASRKLSAILRDLMGEESLLQESPKAVMGALLSFAVDDSSWVEAFRQVQERHRSTQGVVVFMGSLAEHVYVNGGLQGDRARELESFIVDTKLFINGVLGTRIAGRIQSIERQRLQDKRLKNKGIARSASTRELDASRNDGT